MAVREVNGPSGSSIASGCDSEGSRVEAKARVWEVGVVSSPTRPGWFASGSWPPDSTSHNNGLAESLRGGYAERNDRVAHPSGLARTMKPLLQSVLTRPPTLSQGHSSVPFSWQTNVSIGQERNGEGG